MRRYRAAIDAGLLKIMSKMGISVISSYRGGLNFEAVGLSRAMCAEYFPGMHSPHLRHRPHRPPAQGGGGPRQGLARAGAASSPSAASTRRGARARSTPGKPPPCTCCRRPATGRPTSSGSSTPAPCRRTRRSTCATSWPSSRSGPPIPIEQVEIDHRDPQALRDARHVARRALPRGAQDPQRRHEPDRRQVRLAARAARTRRTSCPRPTATTPPPRSSRWPRGASASPPNTSTPARSWRSRSPRAPSPARAASFPGMKVTALIARLRHSTPGVTLISPAAAPRHLLDRGPRPAHLRPQADQPARQGLREAGLSRRASAPSRRAWPRPRPT